MRDRSDDPLHHEQALYQGAISRSAIFIVYEAKLKVPDMMV